MSYSLPSLELSFVEAAYAGNAVGYDLPEFKEVSWAERLEAVAHVQGATKAMQKIMVDRLAWWSAFIDANKKLVPETVLVCPWGGFMALVVYQVVGDRKRYSLSVFTGKQKPSKSFSKKPFTTGYPIDAAESGAYYLSRLNDYQTEAKPFENPHAVGDVLYSTWGCEQTNASFYQVTSVKGLSVTVRPIESDYYENVEKRKNAGGNIMETTTMTGHEAPLINTFKGGPITKKVDAKGYIKINSHESASALEYSETFGVRIYKGVNVTSYA